jgi:beta-hydroxyacyl-ACP dehydratase FabZ
MSEQKETVILDAVAIEKILPHRYPFHLVDKVIEFDPGKRIVGIKNVTMNEPQFQGHFPGSPIMPGVLMIEALAQASGILMLKDAPDMKDKLTVFMSIDQCKFRNMAVPGDTLRLEVDVLRAGKMFSKFQGKVVKTDGTLCAEAELMAGLIDKPKV